MQKIWLISLFMMIQFSSLWAAQAMMLTRGDGNDNEKTNVYAFNIDIQTDTITNFHRVKKLSVKFRSLAYHDGKFWTADMGGHLYTIDINTGNYTRDNTYGSIDHGAIMAMDFDENDNIYYGIWNSSVDTHSFKISLSPNRAQWTGEGGEGKTVDVNVNKVALQKVDW